MTINSMILNTLGKLSVLNKFANLFRTVEDIKALQLLSPLHTEYLPWSDSSIRPSALVSILNDITLNKRTNIVEFGGGISTIFIAKHLRNLNRGGVTTFEHNKEWVDILNNIISQSGLDDFCTVVHAPMRCCSYALNNQEWYDHNVIENTLRPHSIDLVLVDGPLAYSKELAQSRYPALPVIRPFLKSNFSIYLDDINRLGEQKILEKWSHELKLPSQKMLIRGGFGVIHSTAGQTI